MHKTTDYKGPFRKTGIYNHLLWMLYLCQWRPAETLKCTSNSEMALDEHWLLNTSITWFVVLFFWFFFPPEKTLQLKSTLDLAVLTSSGLPYEQKHLDKTHPLPRISQAGPLLTETWVQKSEDQVNTQNSQTPFATAAGEQHWNVNVLNPQRCTGCSKVITSIFFEIRKTSQIIVFKAQQ